MSRTIVLIHGAWVTPLSRQPFIGFFQEPPRGIFAYERSAYRALASVLFTWRGWREVVRWSIS